VAEVVFRLHPLPEASGTARIPGLAPADVRALAKAILDARLEPVALAAFPEGDRFALAARFEGFRPGVAEALERFHGLAAREGRSSERLGAAEETALWARHDAVRGGGDVRLKATFPPAALAAAADALRPLAGALGGGATLVHPALGIAFVAGRLGDAAETARAVAAARAALASVDGPGRAGLRGTLVIAAAPPALRALADPWGAPPAALELMRRLKRELDPEGRLAPGRLPGGL
jgi:glycolate oxidase FAD binding subunit